MYTLLRDIYENPNDYSDKDITIAGWVRTMRSQAAFGFIEINDGTFFKSIQVVFENNLENFSEVTKYSVGSALEIQGQLVLTPNNKQPFEIKAKNIVLEGASSPEYPLQKKRHTMEFLRTIAHLRPRSNTFSAVFRISSIASFAIHNFFNQKGFVYVHTPILTGSDCEGAGEMFGVTTLDLMNVPTQDGHVDYSQDFFSKETNLTVSGQLYAESYALAFRNVYTFGPTFRAENSNTARHAAEFWMMEPEICFAGLKENMQLAEEMLKYVISYVMENAKEEMEFFDSFVEKGLLEKLNNIVNADFAHVTYTEAIDILQKTGEEFKYPVSWGIDLQTEHERYLSEKVYKRPVFVTDYPKDIKAFYMRMNDDGKTVAAMDLLVPLVGELIGGSQREERYDVLCNRMDELGLSKEDYWWYLELRKFGGAKHAGFGLGFERLLMYLTGISNIRDVLPFPRTTGNADF